MDSYMLKADFDDILKSVTDVTTKTSKIKIEVENDYGEVITYLFDKEWADNQLRLRQITSSGIAERV